MKRFLLSLFLFPAALAVGQSLDEPQLTVRQVNPGQIEIAWPGSIPGYALESADALGTATTLWQPAGNAVLRQNEYVVSLAPTGQSQFLRLRSASPTAIRSTSPLNGEQGVAVTRETILYFSAPLSTNTVIDNNTFYASFGVQKILSRVELSSDHTKASLFYLEPLPGSAHIEVKFDASNIHDAAGALVDADGDGVPGGVLTIGFDTLSLTALNGTAVVGTVFASELGAGANGPTNKPLQGVTITVDGMEQTLRTVTDANGHFMLNPVPPGRFFVHIDGRTLVNDAAGIHYPDKSYYPYVGKAWEAVAGKTNNLAGGTGTIFLPLIVQGTLQPVSSVQDTTVAFPASVVAANPALEGVNVTVPANSLFNDNGTRGGKVGIAPVPPDRLPGPLPPGAELPLVITVQTDGALNFDKPAPACFPNLPNPTTGKPWPPGTKGALLSFNHKKGVWESVGDMTVSADGKFFCTDPGVGILQPGWHGPQCPKPGGPPPPPDPKCKQNAEKLQGCDQTCQLEREQCLAAAQSIYDLGQTVCESLKGTATDNAVNDCLEKRYLAFLQFNTSCGDHFTTCETHCIQCYGAGAPPPPPPPNSAPGLRALAVPTVQSDPIVAKIADLYSRAVDLVRTDILTHARIPDALMTQVNAFMQQADAEAGGSASVYLHSRLVQVEDQRIAAARSAGIDPLDLNPGNAPPWPVRYAATVARPGEVLVFRGETEPYGQYSLFLPPDGILLYASFYDPKTKGFAIITPNLSPNAQYFMPRFNLAQLGADAPDFDGDGLPDIVEEVIGTDSTNPDSDGDGIPDGAELDQGTNPLDGLPVSTGVIATVKTPGPAIDVATADRFVATAEGTGGVSLFSVYEGSNPTMLAHLPIAGNAHRVACAGNFVAVAADTGGLVVIDATTPAQAQIVHQIPIKGAQAVVADAGTAWVASSAGRVFQVDLSSGVITASAGALAVDLALEGDFLYALTPDNLIVFSRANQTLAQMGSVASPYTAAPNERLFVGGGIAYAVHRTGYNTIDLSDPAKPVLIKAGNTAQFGWKQIVANGSGLGLAAVGPNSTDDGPHDISLYDLSNPKSNNIVLTTLVTPGIARAAAIRDGLLYVADDTAGLDVLNFLPYDSKRVPPTIKLTPGFPLTGIEEGQPARVSATVSDDVQVRNVEFYINGQIAFVDRSYPFEFHFTTPTLATSSNQFRLRARAVDTGGNASWTDELIVPLLPDLTPPAVQKVSPPIARRVVNSILAEFTEGVDPASLKPQSFQLFTPGADGTLGTADDVPVPGAVSYIAALRSARLQFAESLPTDTHYRAVLTTALTDLAGNHLASNYSWDFTTADNVFSTSFEGGTNAPPGTALNVQTIIDTTGGVNNSGVLKLTQAINGQNGSFVIADLDGGVPVYGFDLTAKVRIGGGSANPADGFSINFDPAAGLDSNPQPAEEGSPTGLSISFDVYDNGNENPPAPSIDLRLDGVLISTHHMTVPEFDTGASFADLHATLGPDGTFTLAWKGSNVFDHVIVPKLQPFVGASFVLAGRTGGYNVNQWFDDLKITTFTAPIVSITAQPAPQEVLAGTTATFSVGVNFPEAATLQWFYDDVPVPGAASATLTVANASASSAGSYKVVVTGANNSVTSQAVPLTVLELHPQASFDFNDGKTPAGTSVTINSSVKPNGGVGDSGVLSLVPPNFGQNGAFVINPLLGGASVSAFTAAFQVQMSGGGAIPADGFSFSFSPELTDQYAGPAEEGVGKGLSISFDVFDNGNETPPAPSIDVRYGGQVIASTHFSVPDIMTGNQYRPVVVRVRSDGKLDLVYGDRVLQSGLPLPGWTPVSNGKFGFFGRTGGFYVNIQVDNVQIEVNSDGAP